MFRILSTVIVLTSCLLGGDAQAQDLSLESSYFAPCVKMVEVDANDLNAGSCFRSAHFQYGKDYFGEKVEQSHAEKMAAGRGWLAAPWVVATLLETQPDSAAVLFAIALMTESEYPALARGHLRHAATLLEAQGLLEEVTFVLLHAAMILPGQDEESKAWGEEGLRLIDAAESAWNLSEKQLDLELFGDYSTADFMEMARTIAEKHTTLR